MAQKDPILPSRKGAPAPPDTPSMLRFSTEALPANQQFAAWKEIVNPMLDVSLPADTSVNDGYRAEITAFNLGGLIVSSEKFDPLICKLPPAALRRGKVDHWLLSLYKTGSAVSRSADAVMESRPGALGLRSLTRPFEGRLSAVEMVLVYIPRDLYPALADSFDTLGDTVLSGGLHSLLFDYLLLLEKQLPHLRPEELPNAARVTKAMIANCLAPARKTGFETEEEDVSATLLQQAKRHIRHHVHSRTLSPDELCRVLGVSRSQLYRLFERHGGVAREIRLERLSASHAALTDPHDRRPVYEIAEAFGFGSADEFGRAFRRHFGYTPRDARQLRGEPPPRPPKDHGADFRSWLFDLGC